MLHSIQNKLSIIETKTEIMKTNTTNVFHFFKYSFTLLLSLNIGARLYAQNFHLVKDINNSTDANPYSGSYRSTTYAVLEGVSYFTADDGIHGQELWRSDGTADSTYMVSDITPGETSSNIYELIVSNDQLFFTANDQLWVSDGSANGTIMLSGPNYVNALSVINGEVYFFAYNSIWKTDGTQTGTVKYIDLPASGNALYNNSLIGINGKIFFKFSTYIEDEELWRTDGTTEGTYMLKNINPTSGSYPDHFTVIDSTLYFTAYDGTNRKLWKSDGTQEGTTLAANDKDVILSNDYYYPYTLVAINNTLYFSGSTSTSGQELYKYDSKAPGIVLVKDIATGTDSSNPANLTNVNGTLFFSTKGPDGNTGLWKSDGSPAGTVLVKNIDLSTANLFGNFYNSNGELYFSYSNTTYGWELWKSNGTGTGTQLIKDIYRGSNSSRPAFFTFVNNQVLFTANDGVSGNELWKSDGSASGTSLLKDINQTSTSGSYPSFLTSFNNKLFFYAFENAHGSELWKSDGTEAGTSLYKDIIPGDIGSSPSYLTPQKNNLYFFTVPDTMKLWKTNGTGRIPVLVKTFTGDIRFTFISGSYGADSLLYFFINNYNTRGLELWRSDGTKQGTFLLKKDFTYSGGSSSPAAVVGNNIFIGNNTDTGAALWKSNGTVEGTVVVKSFQPVDYGRIYNLYPFKGEVFFNAYDGVHNRLWKSDGTKEGTVTVGNVFDAYGYAVSNGTLFFHAEDDSGRHLWKTDGTSEGTQKIKVPSSNEYSYPENLTDVNGTLYFSIGNELWKSNGSDTGTQLVKQFTISSYNTPFTLVNADGTLYFTVRDESYHQSLWQSDGTEAGTHAVEDNSLANVIYINNLTAVGSQLFFRGSTYRFGNELYAGNVRALPIILLNFSGVTQGKQNLLHWTTATEQNNTGFEMQRSSDGNNFSKIGFINTKAINGNSTAKLNYNFIDVDYNALTNYYRLKQIDKDGKFFYSNIVVLKDNNALAPGSITIYPNPVKNMLNVKIASSANDKIMLLITDINGKTIINNATNTGRGESIIQVNISHLSAGTYFLKAICSSGCESAVKKFVKQ